MKRKLLLFALASGLLISTACTKASSTVKYTASGTGSGFTVTYTDASGNNQTYSGSSPWETSFTANSGASLSVSGGTGATGTSEVHIYVNGADRAHDTETGKNASASTTVP